MTTRTGSAAREAIPERADAPAPTPASAPRAVASFADLIALAGDRRDLPLKTVLERDLRLVRFEDGKLEVALEPSASKALIGDLARKLGELTGRRWIVVLSTEQGAPTVKSQMREQAAEIERGVRADPLVQSVLAQFPGAEIVAVRPRETGDDGLPPAALPDGDMDEPAAEPPIEDDASAFGAHSRADDVDDDL